MRNDDLAKVMYDAYCEGVGGLPLMVINYRDQKSFFSDESKIKQANAWRKAAIAAHEFLNPTGMQKSPEQN